MPAGAPRPPRLPLSPERDAEAARLVALFDLRRR
jgi:hypothetical protein